jgi:hypothetical protein
MSTSNWPPMRAWLFATTVFVCIAGLVAVTAGAQHASLLAAVQADASLSDFAALVATAGLASTLQDAALRVRGWIAIYTTMRTHQPTQHDIIAIQWHGRCALAQATVFAPSNAAFATLRASRPDLAAYLTRPELARALVTYHSKLSYVGLWRCIRNWR